MKKIYMQKNGEWIEWDGRDTHSVIVEETILLSKLKENFPDLYKQYKEGRIVNKEGIK